MLNEIPLNGCTSEPLMNYLKALGVLRLVSEQKDPKAKGCWKNGVFFIKSSLSGNELLSFFIYDYIPTPVIVPWSGNDFFQAFWGNKKSSISPKKTPTSNEIITAFVNSKADRIRLYREALQQVKEIMVDMKLTSKGQIEKDKTLKSRFIERLRSSMDDKLVYWFDSCSVFSEKKPQFNILLGSGGGSDGNTHFSDNFMQNLWEMIPQFHDLGSKQYNEAIINSDSNLRYALFSEPTNRLVIKRTSSLFNAGAVGGVNAGQGFERASYGCPWNMILCIEGSLALHGNLSRRLNEGYSEGVFPFQVKVAVSGKDSLVNSEQSGKEFWAPLWMKYADYNELSALLSEGRASVGKKPVKNGTDFSRAIASIAVDRGIDSFMRYSIIKGRVGGDNYNTSTAIESLDVHYQTNINLLVECDFFLEKLRSKLSGDKKVGRILDALKGIEKAIQSFCKYGNIQYFSDILCALGKAEKEIALTKGKIGNGDEFPLKPLSGLSSEWIQACDDGSIEFEIALALSSIYDEKVGSLRQNLEPVKGKGWDEKDTVVSWKSSHLIENMAAILERRMIDMQRQSVPDLPLKSKYYASMEAISVFMAGDVDDRRIGELLWGLCLIDQKYGEPCERREETPFYPISRPYCILKHMFVPEKLVFAGEEIHVKPELSVLPLLRAERIQAAIMIAERRLRSCGLMPMTDSRIDQKNWVSSAGFGDVSGLRLAAALLIPVNKPGMKTISKLVLRQEIKS